MGGSESKIKLLNQKLTLKYDKLNINDLDKLFNDAFSSIKEIEILRCEYILRWNDLVRLTGVIVLQNPKFESCIQGMLWKFAVDLLGNLSSIEILPDEPFIKLNNPGIVLEEDLLISRSFQDLCRLYIANYENVIKLEVEMCKYDKQGRDYLKDPETVLTNRNVAPIDIFTYSKRLNLNVKKTHIAYEVIYSIRNSFEDIRKGLQRYSNRLKEPDQIKKYEEVGIEANVKRITRPKKIVFEFTKEEKLPTYEDHIEILEDDLKAEKEARDILDSCISKGVFILPYSKHKLKERQEAKNHIKSMINFAEPIQAIEGKLPAIYSFVNKDTKNGQDSVEAKLFPISETNIKLKRKAYEDYDYRVEKEYSDVMIRSPVTREYEHTYARSEEIHKKSIEKRLKKTKSNVLPQFKALNYNELVKEVEKLRNENKILSTKIQEKEMIEMNIIDHSKIKITPGDRINLTFKYPTITRHHIPLKNWNLIPNKIVTSDQIQKISCMEPALDLNLLITGGQLGNLTFWKYNNFEHITEHKAMIISKSGIMSLLYLNDGKTLLCGCTDGNVNTIDLEIFSAKLIAELGSSVNSLIYLNNGRSAVAASGNQLHEIDILKEKVLNSFEAHDMEITDLAYNNKKDIIASSSKDKTIKIWNPKTKECLGILRGHARSINTICFAYCDNVSYIVSCARDSYITFWNLADKKLTKLIKMNSIGIKVIYLHDKKSILSVNENGNFNLYNIQRENEKKELSSLKTGYTSAAYLDDGCNIVLASKDGSLEFWNAIDQQTS